MVSGRYILGVDLGTSSIKASVLDLKEKNIINDSVPLEVSYPDSFSAEQNPQDWWQGFVGLIHKLAQKLGNLREIQAVGLSGQMLGLVLMDKGGSPVRPCLIWCDQRSHRENEEIKSKLGLERVVRMTANTPLPGYWLPKILWLRKHEPENLKHTSKFLLPKDFLRFKLTGVYATDVSDASGTLLFDVQNRCWSKEILSIFSIDESLLPQAVESTTITGQITQKAALETGLPEGIPVVGGGGDQSSGGIGLGVIRDGIISCVLGTSGVVMAKTDDVKLDFENRGLHSFCYSMPGKWFLMGCTLAAGGSYRWLREALSVIKPDLSFSEMNRLAESVPAGSEGLLFLPYLIGERTPHSDPMARGVFVGLSYRHTTAHIVRSVIEGVAFSQKDSVEILKSFSLTGETLVLSGGAAKSPLWCQILADVIGITTQTTNIEDPASSGAAFIAGVGSRAFGSFEEVCDLFIRRLQSFEPSSETVEGYGEKYIAYKKVYHSLKEVFPLLQI
jgi:xylulokinase